MNFIFRSALAVFFIAAFAFSQQTHVIESGATLNQFTPADITIDQGDTVRWVNISGFHNVVEDNNLFTSGLPSSANWVFDYVFDNPGDYQYYCEVHGAPGLIGMSGIVHVQAVTDVQEISGPIQFELHQNFPNPFNPTTTISFTLPEAAQVSLTVFNINGEVVHNILNEFLPAGNYNKEFNAGLLTSGVYYYRLTAGKITETRKMLLLK